MCYDDFDYIFDDIQDMTGCTEEEATNYIQKMLQNPDIVRVGNRVITTGNDFGREEFNGQIGTVTGEVIPESHAAMLTASLAKFIVKFVFPVLIDGQYFYAAPFKETDLKNI